MTSSAAIRSDIYDREERKQQYQAHIRGLNAYERHKKFLKDYVRFYGKDKPAEVKLPVKTDQDTLREGYRFIRSEEDDLDPSWEQRLVKRYYDKLFKEYCIADMSRYKTGKMGLRWRTEKEVMTGKGQFMCGSKHCDEKEGLASYEVNFSYHEAGEDKQALVKLVACERCAEKLYYKKRKEGERSESKEKKKQKRKRSKSHSEDDTDEEEKRKEGERSESNEKKKQKRNRSQSHSEYDTDEEDRRKGKTRKSKLESADREGKDDENFDEYMEGMFPGNG
ncbi:folate-sensitive fragile site protein [Arabidopsis thaliana]|uniref:Folate-sensitive fragile site protein n=1 Tax=Arabidopsis thaliana TaxID=3702 RepID=F4JJC4_ARATH|nr:folate-sensitive fragile site protein [Arabidopsis thaliana]AEE83542.1 folate-sensitive fragile site protein [Arabidopsis thaliana]|eukprot:NP_193239.5 folate-sensitive fragile site protein [Arabidopsis thaliana]